MMEWSEVTAMPRLRCQKVFCLLLGLAFFTVFAFSAVFFVLNADHTHNDCAHGALETRNVCTTCLQIVTVGRRLQNGAGAPVSLFLLGLLWLALPRHTLRGARWMCGTPKTPLFLHVRLNN
jgi:hypothetical protein